jgi:hypothetical protein
MSAALGSARHRVPHLTSSVWLLGFMHIIGYGALYYGFAVLAEDMARSLSWPRPQRAVAMTVLFVVNAPTA